MLVPVTAARMRSTIWFASSGMSTAPGGSGASAATFFWKASKTICSNLPSTGRHAPSTCSTWRSAGPAGASSLSGATPSGAARRTSPCSPNACRATRGQVESADWLVGTMIGEWRSGSHYDRGGGRTPTAGAGGLDRLMSARPPVRNGPLVDLRYTSEGLRGARWTWLTVVSGVVGLGVSSQVPAVRRLR